MKGIKYLSNYYCNEHPLEKLNLVCISKQCPKRGLICSRCKNDQNADDNPHIGHESNIVPFKYLFENLDQNLHRKRSHTYSINTEYQFFQQLKATQTEALFYLNQTVIDISKSIQQVQLKIMEGFQTAKSSIMFRGEIIRKFQNMMEKAIMHDVRKEQRYEFINDMRNLVSFIEDKQNREYRYQITANPPQILANYIKQNLSLKFKCQKLNQLVFLFSTDQILRPNQQKQFLNFTKKQKTTQNDEIIKQQKIIQNLDRLRESQQKVQKDKVQQKTMQNLKKFVEQKNKKNKIHSFAKKMTNALKNMKEISQEVISDKKFPKQQQAKNDLELQQKVEKHTKHKKMYQLFQNMQQDPLKIVDQQLFSQIAKSPTIKITKNGRVAKQTEDQFGIVILNSSLLEKTKISFKISKLKTEIVVGLGLIDIVKTHKYMVPSKLAPHGLFGLSSKGICWHHNEENNSQKTDYLYEQHDIINLKYEKGIVYFQRCGGKKGFKDSWIFQLKTSLQEQDRKKISFLVALNGNDSVQIM